jgi:hypothetical protein
MEITCTLTIKDDEHAEYEDDVFHPRNEGEMVSGRLGGPSHVRDTIRLLNGMVATEGFPCTRHELMILGCHLYDVAFGIEGAPLREAFEKTHRRFNPGSARERLRLRLVIEQEAKELSGFPWEFLYMPGNPGFFLAGERTELILTRYVPEPPMDQADLEPDGALRILIVVSQPSSPGLTTVAGEKLINDIVTLQDSRDLKIQVLLCESPTRAQLGAKVRKHKPHVVHFVGHGEPGRIALRSTDDQIMLARADFERRTGKPPAAHEVDEADWADAASMREHLHAGLEDPESPRRLFFLHACEGASPIKSEHALVEFRNLAEELAAHRKVAAVVAMQYKISNTDAQSFAREFYEQMRAGCKIDEAVSLARRKLGSAPEGPGRQSWNDRGFGTPVIYLRDERPLFHPPPPPQPQPDVQPPVQPGPRRKTNCPNTRCDGLVIPGRPPCKEMGCGVWFEDCPVESCDALVVPKAGQMCTGTPGHEYVEAGGRPARQVAPAAASETSSRAATPAAQPGVMQSAGGRSGQLGLPTKPPTVEDGNGDRPG